MINSLKHSRANIVTFSIESLSNDKICFTIYICYNTKGPTHLINKHIPPMKNRIRRLASLFYILLSFVSVVRAQDTVLNRSHGKIDSLHSAVLNQERLIQLFLPADYKPSGGKKYDVLYVLDGGNWNTGIVADVEHFVENEGLMPSTIIVSVMGIDRNVELTPTHLADWKGSGGAPLFLSFIKNELIPYINKNYPSNGDNTLWGHSLSAMFAIYAMVNEPGLFKSYIAIDPSIWWDHCYVAKIAAAKLPGMTSQNLTLFIAGREGALTSMKIDSMETVLKSTAPKNLNWKLQIYNGETHSSVRFKGTYDGLRFTYDGLTSHIAFHPMNGIVLKDKPYPILFFNDTARLRYTLDGTIPTSASPKVRPLIMVTGASTVTYKAFSNRSRYDQLATGVFYTTKVPPPVKRPNNYQPGGFNYAYYETNGDSTVDLKKLKPLKTGITDKDFDVDKLPAKTNSALVMDGFLEVKEDGYYIFVLNADTGSKLYIAGKLMITWNGDYTKLDYSCIIPLSKGFYPLKLEYDHSNPDFKLKLSYVPPGNIAAKNLIPIPLELQYGRK